MKNFIKENLVLVVGLTFPLLLILIFFASTVIPKAMSAPPQYEVLFTTKSYDYQNTVDYMLDFSVKNQKLMVSAKKHEGKDINYDVKRLMVYDAKTDTVREIAIDMSQVSATAGAVALHETENMVIDTAIVSPDGYTLDGPSYGGGGLMGGLFGGGNRDGGFRLKKGNVGYKIPHTQQHYYYNQVQFIGWVIKK
ncbi:hypothetical protein [Methylotenera mobilis]|uniref:Uncharacterized protein n=1 Tax=Methylotenera mobilis (strain JLW8 / ATCC BAA-1282 / DSM 17540) TaxID=583345 RepID=C6WV06_METML|nr:hypothetical protein [Methylotenera mobilis]ACT47755.1 conserved hypothetical protein [Methylotenera mobilis JLW8]